MCYHCVIRMNIKMKLCIEYQIILMWLISGLKVVISTLLVMTWKKEICVMEYKQCPKQGPWWRTSFGGGHSNRGVNVLSLFFFFFGLFRAAPASYGSSEAKGQTGAADAGLHHSHSNARSLSHWARSGIDPASSGILAQLVSTEPQWELYVFSYFSIDL